MTAAEKAVLVLAKTCAVFVDPYVTNTRGISADEAEEMVRTATRCEGSGPSFVLDNAISITVDSDGITVLGIGR